MKKRLKGVLFNSFIGLVFITGMYIALFLILSFTALSFEFAWERMKVDFMLVRAIILSVVVSVALTDWISGGMFKKQKK